MALFAIMVLAPAALPHFGWFVATRLIAGALQGLFLAAAFTTATAVVPPERVGRALATVIAGFSISTVLGLPLGVLVGSVLGWRGALPVVAVTALLAWAVFASSAPASVQYRVVSLAGPGGTLVASLPASAASAGIALGSTASGLAYTAAGPPAVVLTGLVIALGALALALATRRLGPSPARSAGGEEVRQQPPALVLADAAAHIHAMIEPRIAYDVEERGDRAGLGVVRAEDQRLHPGQNQSAGTHRARLEGDH